VVRVRVKVRVQSFERDTFERETCLLHNTLTDSYLLSISLMEKQHSDLSSVL